MWRPGTQPPSRSKEIPEAPADLNDLSMEVSALQGLHRLQLTSSQLQVLARVGGLAVKGETRERGKASGRYRTTLVELRTALLRSDDQRISTLHDRLEEQEAADNPDLDDGFEISDKARAHAGDFLRLLTARQVMHYLSEREEAPDLLLLILTTSVKGRSMKGEEWKELRDEVAEEVADLLAGVHQAEHKRVTETVTALLDAGQRSKEKDLEKLKKETEAAVASLVGNRGPLDLARNVLERDLAELLSNPRFHASVQALLASKR